jgi:hypothetical protein
VKDALKVSRNVYVASCVGIEPPFHVCGISKHKSKGSCRDAMMMILKELLFYQDYYFRYKYKETGRYIADSHSEEDAAKTSQHNTLAALNTLVQQQESWGSGNRSFRPMKERKAPNDRVQTPKDRKQPTNVSITPASPCQHLNKGDGMPHCNIQSRKSREITSS